MRFFRPKIVYPKAYLGKNKPKRTALAARISPFQHICGQISFRLIKPSKFFIDFCSLQRNTISAKCEFGLLSASGLLFLPALLDFGLLRFGLLKQYNKPYGSKSYPSQNLQNTSKLLTFIANF